METKKYVLGFVAAMIAGAAVAMTACGDAPQRTEERLADIEKQLIEERGNTALAQERGKTALAEEKLAEANRQLLEALLAQDEAVLAKEEAERAAIAASERASARMASQEEARARYECNMKIAAALTVVGHLVGDGYEWDWYEKTDEEIEAIFVSLYQYPEAEEGIPLLMKWGVDSLSWWDDSVLVRDAYFESVGPLIGYLKDGDC